MTILNAQKIVKRSAEVQAADSLRLLITDGTIPLGARITETQLSEEMGLSRATIRAALHQLSTEGLTTLVPYTGWTVISLSTRDVWELYTLRLSLERLAAQLVATTLDKSKVDELTESDNRLMRACKSGRQDEIAEADFALHKSIISLAGHGRLKWQYEHIENQIRLVIKSSDSLIEDPETIYEQHHPLVDAILRGDAQEAGALAEVHNECEGKKLLHHLQCLEEVDRDGQKNIQSVRETRLRNLKPRKNARVQLNN
jgi:DNA-binding GntR family transcriptional regulator